MASLRHDGIVLAYDDHGQGEPFVFQHGLGGDRAQPRALYRHAGRQLCLDCRGHGDSEPLGPEERLGFGTFASDLLALLDALELDRVLLGGISMGAGVALRLAAEHPERVRALVLVRPAWALEPAPSHLRPFRTVAGLLERHDPAEGRRRFERSLEFAAVARQSPASARSLLGQFDRRLARERAPVLEALAADRPLAAGARFADVDRPALVLGTAGDPLHPFAIAEAIAKDLPAAQLREVPSKDAGEELHRARVGALIDDFLAS
jgi:pimeloyl-ACP methyl ester carboxylesterase